MKYTKIKAQTLDCRADLCYNRIMKKRAIAFDIGDKRIGVAISDPFNEYAMPCETYFRTRSLDTDTTALAKIASERGVGVIVCGMPVNFDGTESVQTVKTREFIDALSKKTDLPIELEDERFTTMQARETQMMGGIKRDERKKTVDSIAASYILEGWLTREKIKEKKEQEMKDEELLDEFDEEEGIIEVEDEDGTLVKFAHIANVPYKGTMYCIFEKAEIEDEDDDEGVVIFALDEEKGLLNTIQDDALLDEVFAEFCRLYENSEDADDAMRLDN